MPRALLILLYFVLASVLSGVIFIGSFLAFGKIISQAEIAGLGLILILFWLSAIIGFIATYFLLLKKFRSSTTSPSPFWLSFVLHSLVVAVLHALLVLFVSYLPDPEILRTTAGLVLLAGLTYLVGRSIA